MNSYLLPPTSEALNYLPPVRLPNSYGRTLSFASPRHLAEAVDVTPRGERQWWVDPLVEENRHHRRGQGIHRRSHHRTPPETHHPSQRANPAYANPYAPPIPAPRPARAPMPAPAPPVVPAQAYMAHAPAPRPQQPVGVRPAPAPQNYFANTAPVIPPMPVPTVAPVQPEYRATNDCGDHPLPYDPESYTRYYDPSGAPVPRVLPTPAAAPPPPPTQNADPRPSRGRRLSNAFKSLFHKGDCSRASAPAPPPQVVYVPIPAAGSKPAAPKMAPQPAPLNRPAAIAHPAEGTTAKSSPVFNIYTRDMLPQIYGTGRDFQRDPHWKGADKENINVLMPVGLLDCWSILFNARNLKEIHFWHITGDDGWREFPSIRVRKLKSFHIHLNEGWLTNLLNSLRIRDLRHMEVYYSSGGGGRFVFDKDAYSHIVEVACQHAGEGSLRISPNHPAYFDRHSSLKASLEAAVAQRESTWSFDIRDRRQ
ncbi:uncharacterized protein SCHCODRAFT_02570330 [Schizophyllum commune H4-8]|nr:uncharacterized protein SCHCODRAFT_02570330 [Schizophyllum commune H4-8]KAI5896994.1 hypothetical protein SCHCODRAFT_02570330 [Schizophyllum commune H4-8]